MRDFTMGSIPRHLVGTAGFIGFGLIVQTMYLLVDIYFVGSLGANAQAGVAAGGSALFIVMAANQLVSIGTLSLIARAAGRKDMQEAQLIFEQSVGVALFASLSTLLLGYLLGGWAVQALCADDATASAARAYLYAFLPALALMYPTASIGSALRATGVVGVPMAIQSASVALNVVLAPVLIVGWGTGIPLGAAGAGLASSLAAFAGILTLIAVFTRLKVPLRLRTARPAARIWRAIARIGLPASGEFLMTFIVFGTIYLSTRPFGAEAQAGYGVGFRIMQAVFLPTLAIAFAIPPVAGQNYGAGRLDRVRTTFLAATAIGCTVMLTLTLFCRLAPELLVSPFTSDAQVRSVAAGYLRAVSWNFAGMSVIYCCSATFQGLGNTLPALYSSASRLVTFVIPMLLISGRAQIELEDIWLLTNASVAVHVAISLTLLRREFGLRAVERRAAAAYAGVREQAHGGRPPDAFARGGGGR